MAGLEVCDDSIEGDDRQEIEGSFQSMFLSCESRGMLTARAD